MPKTITFFAYAREGDKIALFTTTREIGGAGRSERGETVAWYPLNKQRDVEAECLRRNMEVAATLP